MDYMDLIYRVEYIAWAVVFGFAVLSAVIVFGCSMIARAIRDSDSQR